MGNNYNPNFQERVYHPRPSHRRMAIEVVKTHEERKQNIKKNELRIAEMYEDVASARIDGMPKTKRQYTDKTGERLDKLDQLQKYIDRNIEMVKAVETSLELIGRGRRVTRAMITEYGSKAKLYYWARKSIELSIQHGETGCDYGRWAWGERCWSVERRMFIDRIAEALYFCEVSDV